MEEKKNAVEGDQKAAADQQEVKKDDAGASAAQQDDLAAQIIAKDAEIKKIAEERDNYKAGLLKAKGKNGSEPADDDHQPDDLDSKIQKAVQETLYSEKEKRLQAEKDALFQQALKENREMKVALGNKQGISTTGDGGSSDTKTTTPQFFSDEQIRDLKARGWDDAKIKKAAENMRR